MNKEKLKGIIVGLLVGMIFTGSIAMAASTTTLHNVKVGGIKIVVDGETLNPKDANGKRVDPMIYNGTTYLPVRAVGEAIGKSVYWDGPNSTVYLGKMDGKLEYPAEYLTENNIGSSFYKASGTKLKDNYGNTYSEGLYFIGKKSAEYLINMKYSRLKGTLYVPSGETSNQTYQMKVVADGKVIYTSPEMNKTSSPVPFNINVTGYNHIKLEFVNVFTGYSIYVGDAGFYQ